MAQTDPKNEAMKQALKETLHEVFAEVLDDFALSGATREGRQTERVERDEVFDVLEGRA